jgi:hypothetical protein
MLFPAISIRKTRENSDCKKVLYRSTARTLELLLGTVGLKLHSMHFMILKLLVSLFPMKTKELSS